MKKLYVLCLVTLLAVLVDLVLFHARTANAQTIPNYKVAQIDNVWGLTFPLTGTVVGFSCVVEQGETRCYVATKQ